jgi:glyoxylase-like metal-dependent hydrolase (beta-lactamase superfamily II)
MVTRRTLLTAAAPLVVAGSASAQAPASSMTPASGASSQAPGFYRYKVGAIEVTAINDGFAMRPLDGFIPNAPPAELKTAMEDAFLPSDALPLTFTSVVLRTGGRTVLVDTGFADNGPPTTGHWMANFRAAGFDPAAVDDIVITHFHPDHISGIRRKDGSAVFPKAQVHVPDAEWVFWTDEARAAQASEALKPTFAATRRVFGPIMAQVKRFAAGAEVVPSLSAVAAYGHTPGHTAFMLSSGTDRQLIMGDVANHPALFVRNPDWSAVFDMDAAQARATRRTMLDKAATERVQVSFYHAPFPAVGHILKGADGYRFVPLQWSPVI